MWELYDGATDWTQARDLAEKMPERLAALQRLWLIEAVKYNVLPIDDRRFERLNADHRRPAAADHRHHAGAVPRDEAAEREQRPRHQEPVVHRDRGAFETPGRGDMNGVVIAQGGRFGGWALYFKEGRAKFVYNLLGMQEFVTEANEAVTPGSHQVRVEFAYDGGGLGKGGDVTLYYDGRSVGSGRVEH